MLFSNRVRVRIRVRIRLLLLVGTALCTHVCTTLGCNCRSPEKHTAASAHTENNTNTQNSLNTDSRSIKTLVKSTLTFRAEGLLVLENLKFAK